MNSPLYLSHFGSFVFFLFNFFFLSLHGGCLFFVKKARGITQIDSSP